MWLGILKFTPNSLCVTEGILCILPTAFWSNRILFIIFHIIHLFFSVIIYLKKKKMVQIMIFFGWKQLGFFLFSNAENFNHSEPCTLCSSKWQSCLYQANLNLISVSFYLLIILSKWVNKILKYSLPQTPFSPVTQPICPSLDCQQTWTFLSSYALKKKLHLRLHYGQHLLGPNYSKTNGFCCRSNDHCIMSS